MTTTPKKMCYDFEITSFVGIESPEGTDPDTLTEQAIEEFVRRLQNHKWDKRSCLTAEVQCFRAVCHQCHALKCQCDDEEPKT